MLTWFFVSLSRMETLRRIAELEARHAELDGVVARAVAEMAGIRTELNVLRRGAEPTAELAELKLTDAIVVVLREAGGSATPVEIRQRLAEAGVTVSNNKTTATLDYLLKQGRVMRPSRGRYVAV